MKAKAISLDLGPKQLTLLSRRLGLTDKQVAQLKEGMLPETTNKKSTALLRARLEQLGNPLY
ncbi:MAG: hypothetical protein HY094_04730 [Candidatus Melainabacteria bacterium]|nr:hypothetical protein [Candidatus Melainabacteria bacterium]